MQNSESTPGQDAAAVDPALLFTAHLDPLTGTASQLSAIDAWAFDAILSKDLQGRITNWNRGAQHLYGYTAAEAVGQHISFIVPSHKRAELDTVMRRIAQGQRFEPFETQRQCKDGQIVDVSLAVSPILNRKGEIVAASAIARDITRQKRAERAQAISEQKYQDLYDNAPDMYASLDAANARIVGCNQTLAPCWVGRARILSEGRSGIFIIPAVWQRRGRRFASFKTAGKCMIAS